MSSETTTRLPGPSLRARIAPFIVMDVMRAANARQMHGDDIIHMEVGQPATPAPRLVREAAKRAIDSERLGYTEALGHWPLRERLARHYREAYGVTVPPQRIVITTGSSAGFILAFLALFDANDAILLPEPGYPCYRQIAAVLGLKPLAMRAAATQHWRPDLETVRHGLLAHQAKGMLAASPANPTGTMLAAAGLHALQQICDSAGACFISDEIYHGLTYAAPAQTALALSQNAIIIGSFSKYYSMTGWRVGWMVLPEALVRTIERLQQNLFIAPPAISQHAAIAAFDAVEELEQFKSVYAANRDVLLNALPQAGFAAFAPADGAFYIYADISHRSGDSAGFAARMLAETGIAVTPGMDFDPLEGHRYIRFSYSGSPAEIIEATKRLRAWQAR